MFDNLSDRLNSVFKNLKGHGRLNEDNIRAGLREVRLALLEADVNYKVVRDFTARIKERALGQDVLQSLTPGQQVVKVVNEELVELLGGESRGLNLRARPPVVIMLAGLQGSGKTTTAAKLALHLRREHKMSPYMVPADVYRPAAIDQLTTLGEQLDVPVYGSTSQMNPVDICLNALNRAREEAQDVVILDTAGRLHIDETLMQELADIKSACTPQEILFVADAMTGQDAVNVAERFDQTLDMTGVVLTKMEGDARGGAALSIKHITDKPIKFIGTGEKVSDLEVFHPDRVASRILGMGDVLTLIEKAQEGFDEKEAESLEKKLKKSQFDLEDFRTQMRRLKKLGSVESLVKLIPGMGKFKDQLKNVKMPDKELARVEAIISSMTAQERQEPKIINSSRKQRISSGSGTSVQEVNQLLKNFEQMQKMMKGMVSQQAGGGNQASADQKKLRKQRKKAKQKNRGKKKKK